MGGVAQGTIDKWEGISNAKDGNTYNPPDLTIKVAKAEHHAKLFLLTSGCTGTRGDYKKIDTDKICSL